MLKSTTGERIITLKGNIIPPFRVNHQKRTVAPAENLTGKFTKPQLRAFLLSCVVTGASDITFQTDQEPRILLNGGLYLVKTRCWTPTDTQTILEELYRSANAQAEISGQKVLDFSYEIKPDSGPKLRFRVNAIGVRGWDATGVEISIRILPDFTPDPECVGLTEEEVDLLTPSDGLVVVAGSTGSGKSSTLAAMVRHHLEATLHPRKIVSIDSPVEFTYRDIPVIVSGSPTIIGQSEVGYHIPSFADGVRSALRRNPDIIIIGEARDKTTVSATVEASLTGHLVYTTTHAYSVANTIQRFISVFDGNRETHKALDILTSLRVIMVQKLIPGYQNKQQVQVLREYLEFTPMVRERLLAMEPHDWPNLINCLIADPTTIGIEPFPRSRSFQTVNDSHHHKAGS